MSTRTARTARPEAAGRRKHSVPDLLRQSAEALMVSPVKAYELARTAYERSQASGDEISVGKSLHALGLSSTFLSEYDQAEAYLAEARTLFATAGNEIELARVYNSIGIVRHRMGDAAGALRAYREGAALLEDKGDAFSDLLGRLQCNIALIHRGLGDYREASRILLDLLPMYEQGRDEQAAVILDNLGAIHAELGDFELSRRYYLRALERSRRDGYLYGQAMTLGNLGAACNDAGYALEALEYLEESLAICRDISDRDGIARVLHNIGISYNLQQRYPLALRYMRRSAKEALATGNVRSHYYTLAAIGGLLRRTGKPHEAIRSLEKALKGMHVVEEALLEYEIHEELSHAHEAIGNLAEALRHHRRYAELRQLIQSEKTRRTIAELEIRFDLERSEKEKEIYRLRNEQLENDLRVKTSELTAMALRLVQRSEMLDSVKEGIVEVLRAQNGSAHPTLRSMLHTVEGESRFDDGWRSFEQQFQRVHPDYIRALSVRYAALSPTELKICALLKTNLNSKEIARLLHVSLRDIENHRYRIRKKLALAAGENLSSFLAGM